VESAPAELVAFCEALHPRLVGTLVVHTGDREVARECAQEALVRVCERWPEVSAMASPAGWTYRVAFNLTSSRGRRRAIERRALARLAGRRTDLVAAPEQPLDAEPIRAAVAALPPRQRQAVVLRYFADLSVEDTAAAMGCATGTVKSLTAQAVAALRRALAAVEGEDVRGGDDG
jgi:RNA polymerase sigma factor (sigma-70 family)